MIQIIVCWCTEHKFRDAGEIFYAKEKFYENTNDIYVAPCPRLVVAVMVI